MALVVAQARAPRRRSSRIAQQQAATGGEADAAELLQAELADPQEEEEAAPASLAPSEAPSDVQSQEQGQAPVLEVSVLRQMQQQQPLMRALSEYIVDRKLPVDRLQRIRVLEIAPLYEVNQAGLLCRVRGRGDNSSLGVAWGQTYKW